MRFNEKVVAGMMNSLSNRGITTWSIDKETNLLSMSSDFKRWGGVLSDERYHRPNLLQEMVYAEDVHIFKEHMDKLYTGQTSSLEHRILIHNNELMWVQSIGIPVLNKDNEVYRIDGIVLDITEKKTMQEQLESTFSLYQKMLDTIDVAIWSYDTISRRVSFISDAIAKITGYPAEKAKESNFWSDIIHKDEKGIIEKIMATVAQGIPDLNEYRIIHANGEIRWIQVRIIPSLDRSRSVVRLDGIVADITARKVMEEALHRNEQRYKSLFEYNSDVVCELDLFGNILASNPVAENITGEQLNSSEESLSIMNVFGAEHAGQMTDYFEKAIEGDSQHYVVTSHHKDGGVVHWDLMNVPIQVNNRIVGVFAIAKEVTVKRETEKRLAECEAEYRLITDNMKDMMVVLDSVGNVSVASPSCQSILGIPIELIMDTTILEHIHPDDRQDLIEQIKDMFKTKRSKLLRIRFVHVNGYIIYLESLGTPVFGDDGEMANIVILSRDITKKVKIENELRASEERYQRLIELSPEAIVLHSDYKFIYVNFAGLELFGVSSLSELVGKSIFQCVHPDYRTLVKERLRESIYKQQRLSSPNEQKVIRADGEIIDVEVMASSISYKGENAGISIFRDIRDRKRAEEDRKNSEQTIRESEERYYRLQMSLDQFSHDLFGIMKISQMEERLLKEVRELLEVSNVSIIEVEHNHDKLCEIIETEKGYSLKIGETKGKSYLLCIDEKPIILNITSIRVWLKTITRYVSVLFDHFLLIEDLTKELEQAASGQFTPPWLLRFLFNLSENERKHLAQDLHDSALQEQIIWYRKLDFLLIDRSIPGELREQLEQITEGLLNVIHQIRITCNELRPPMIIKGGLISSLETLFDFTQLRTNYAIHFDAEHFNQKLDDDVLIGLYRIVQELLANAAKHSSATEVRIILSSQGNRVRLEYEDNGIGMELTGTENSPTRMGIYGMRERVRSMDGTIQFLSSKNKGLAIYISVSCKR
ncbi:sensor histidine kinase [Paenibacillus sp. IHBB 10380]|uniref:sensor histidine kinase n=1 Tax=Paenibacillus sp. IHBB 10380 TaxID=1566358 RepID=UPI0009E3C812|nr:PAS domain S-box protein [Paenibacillus sp. IHBB 10380]